MILRASAEGTCNACWQCCHPQGRTHAGHCFRAHLCGPRAQALISWSQKLWRGADKRCDSTQHPATPLVRFCGLPTKMLHMWLHSRPLQHASRQPSTMQLHVTDTTEQHLLCCAQYSSNPP